MYMLKSLTIKNGHRIDTYYTSNCGFVTFETAAEAERFLIAAGYCQDGKTGIWNRTNSDNDLDQVEIVERSEDVFDNHCAESLELLNFLESYQAEQKQKALEIL